MKASIRRRRKRSSTTGYLPILTIPEIHSTLTTRLTMRMSPVTISPNGALRMCRTEQNRITQGQLFHHNQPVPHSYITHPPAMPAVGAASTTLEQGVIPLSPQQLEGYSKLSSAAFNTRNQFDFDDEDEPLPGTVGSTPPETSSSSQSQSTSAQTSPIAIHGPQTVPESVCMSAITDSTYVF